ncbi:hypothetical protein KUG88_25010 [Rhodococcus rhodochrous]|uniref:hypothetical protein n=1 Tax=Rhodococcus rhodochrous TaxID=1829 RepID=UPI001E64349E|nr:hypothetical protein [Rhodococcus rhodochrous]MCB8913382.1 hypothetical protein [Rhodococcus rhodochrous]
MLDTIEPLEMTVGELDELRRIERRSRPNARTDRNCRIRLGLGGARSRSTGRSRQGRGPADGH